MNNLDDFVGNVSRRFILMSFIIALLVDLIPLPDADFFWVPKLSALVLVFWLINKPRMVGLGCAFALGLILDVGLNAPLGQYALAYSLTSYIVMRQQKQITYYSYGTQSLVIFGAIVGIQAIISIVRLFYYHQFIGWAPFFAAFIAALIWPIFNKLMVFIIQFKRA